MSHPVKNLFRIGLGIRAQVWAAVDSEGRLIARKVFPTEALEAAKRAYEIAAELKHPNLLHPVSFDEEHCTIILPYCEGRSADNAAGHFFENQTWMLLKDIGEALAYLHGKGLSHGDVKPAHILWDGSRFLLSGVGEEHAGSYQFAAPEKIKGPESDIWSLGASLFNLVLDAQVFGGLGGRAQRPESVIPVLRKNMPELSALIGRCLSYDMKQRPTAQEIVNQAGTILARQAGKKVSRPLKAAKLTLVQDNAPDFWPEAMTDAL